MTKNIFKAAIILLSGISLALMGSVPARAEVPSNERECLIVFEYNGRTIKLFCGF